MTQTLEAASTFLPLIDDLLSPEFRPVLQTPTTATPSSAPHSATAEYLIGKQLQKQQQHRQNGSGSFETNSDEAAAKIQQWWRNQSRVDKVKHSIRHNRTEEYVSHLQSEIKQLRSALLSERRMRSLQLEAIRSLWSQVQRMGNEQQNQQIMSQSLPSNGFNENQLIVESNHHCNCSTELSKLRETFQQEINELRKLILNGSSNRTTTTELENESGTDESTAKRPATLNFTGHQVVGYANEMAVRLIENASSVGSTD